MGAKTLLSLEEFQALPDDAHRYELKQGALYRNASRPSPNTISSVPHVAHRGEAAWTSSCRRRILFSHNVIYLAIVNFRFRGKI
jgi:hypothetical protein